MIFDMYNLCLAIFALAGLAICRYIRRAKAGLSPMVCPLNGHCMGVVTSRYGKTAGVNNELIGSAYYGSVFVLAAAIWLRPEFLYGWPALAALVAMGGAFLMSLYLVGIQLFVLRQTCSWCLTTAVINGTVLVLGLALV